MQFPPIYNPSDSNDILRYAKWLIGKTFYEVLETDLQGEKSREHVSGYSEHEDGRQLIRESAAEYGNVKRKGGLGNLIEKHFFHYEANSNPEADFSLAGLELKVTPYEEREDRKNRQKYYVAGERLVLTMIDFNRRPIEFNFYKSHVWEKCQQILLIYYLRKRALCNNLDYHINYVDIFSPNNKDLIIIIHDYKLIMNKIASGKAHEISESDTMYLGACTKGKKAATSIVIQDIGGVSAKKRAFCFKTSYMTTVLNDYFINPPKEQESVITDADLLDKLGFEGYIQSIINQYVGKSDKELCGLFGLEYNRNKSQWISLALAMLGVKSNKAEEFQKADIVVKAMRINEDGNIAEHTSFPPFKFKDLVMEQWVDSDEEDDDTNDAAYPAENIRPSTLQAYFATKKFLFVVFKKHGEDYVLKGSQLWNMPYNDLNIEVRTGWEKIRQTIIDGIVFTKKEVGSGERKGKYTIGNNLPKQKDNRIIHIRPHANRAYYKFDDFEDGNPSDGNELPDGRWMTTQCFWLNNSYVKSVLRNDLK